MARAEISTKYHVQWSTARNYRVCYIWNNYIIDIMAVKFYPLLHRLLSTLWPWLSWLWEPRPGRCGGDMADIIVTWRHSQGTLAGYISVTCGERKLLAMRFEFLSTCWMKRVLCALAAAGAGFILKHAVTSTFCPIKNVRRTQLIFIAAGKWLLLTRYGKFSLKKSQNPPFNSRLSRFYRHLPPAPDRAKTWGVLP